MTADLFICFHICVHVHVYQSDSACEPALHFTTVCTAIIPQSYIFLSLCYIGKKYTKVFSQIISALHLYVFAQDMYKNQGASSFHTRSLCFKQPNTIQMYLMVFPNEIKQKSGATNDLEIQHSFSETGHWVVCTQKKH